MGVLLLNYTNIDGYQVISGLICIFDQAIYISVKLAGQSKQKTN